MPKGHARWLPTTLLWLAAALGTPAFAQKTSTDALKSVAACIGCHGAKGEGIATFPRLAGTGQVYLQAQLDAFGNGSRKNAIMQPIAQQLTAAQRTEVAQYFSQLPAPFLAADPAQPLPADVGAWLATRGRWSDNVPACVQCHGPGGRGVGPQFPPLAGLPAAYITEQLQAWKAGSRPPGPLALMTGIAQQLTEADIAAVAAYYANLAKTPDAVPAKALPPKSRP
ncbi:MAG: c-type cytochrome [Polaromonas sp.]|jgi:cytochrome c553|nr:c-type cytochrome [Polaromonas sp.]